MGNKVGTGSRRCREAGCNRFPWHSYGDSWPSQLWECHVHFYEKVKKVMA